MAHEIGVASNGTLKALQPFTGDAAFLQGFMKTVQMAVAAQKFQVSLANDDVVRSCVVMQLLVPFLEEMPAHLLEVMAMHDLQDFVTDPLTIPATTDGRQHEPIKRPALSIAAIELGEPS